MPPTNITQKQNKAVGELRMPELKPAEKFASVLCHGAFLGDFRNLRFDLVRLEGNTEPSWDLRAGKGRAHSLPETRVSLSLTEGLKLIADTCAPKPLEDSVGRIQFRIQDKFVYPRFTLQQYDPQNRSESELNLEGFNRRFINSEDPSVIDLGKDKDGVHHRLLPARIININETSGREAADKEATFVLQKIYRVNNQNRFHEEFKDPEKAAQVVREFIAAQ